MRPVKRVIVVGLLNGQHEEYRYTIGKNADETSVNKMIAVVPRNRFAQHHFDSLAVCRESLAVVPGKCVTLRAVHVMA